MFRNCALMLAAISLAAASGASADELRPVGPASPRRSCPWEWCKSGGGPALSGGRGLKYQAATAGSLTMGSSLNGAMVSSVM